MNGWFLFGLIVVILVLFFLTWFNISQRADADDQRNLKRKYDDLEEAFQNLRRQYRTAHEGYGPTQQHVAALDQAVTLQLQTPPGIGAESYFSIPSPEQYKVGYATCSEGVGTNSTERSLTLRELLNRVLKDIPVELVHEVKPDWNFIDTPPPPPFVLSMPSPLCFIDNRKSPIEFSGLDVGKGSSATSFGLHRFNDHN